MSILLDEIGIDGVCEPGRVIVSFANTKLNIDLASARKIARAILDQADISELELLRQQV